MARTTTTALLRTQKSRAEEIQNWEDTLLDYEWQLSAKTADDWELYKKHYEDRQAGYTDDPEKLLSAQKKIDAGFRSYQTNEIQRVAIDILEGNATEEDKLNKLSGLYAQSYAYGYYDLAQALRLQIDNQIIKIQQAYQSAASYGGGGGGYYGSSYGTTQKQQDTIYKQGIEAQIAEYKKDNVPIYQLPDGTVVTLQDLSNYIKTKGEDYLNELARGLGLTDAQPGLELIVSQVSGYLNQLQAQAAQIQDPATREKLLADIAALRDYKLDIASDSDAGNITINQLEGEIQARLNNNGQYTWALGGPNGYTLQKFTVQDILTGANQIRIERDEAGNEYAIFGTQYGNAKSLQQNLGYGEKEQVVYELRDGKYRPIMKAEINITADGKWQRQKNQLQQLELFQLMGITPQANNTYKLNDTLQKILKNSGLTIGATGLVTADAIKFDPYTGMPEILLPDGSKVITWETYDKGFRPVVYEAKTGSQYLQDIGYTTAKEGASTTNVLGNVMYTNLQPAANAAAIQAQQTARFIQPAGTSGLLQQAASATRINQINTEEIRKLQVAEEQRIAQALAMYKPPATTVSVSAAAPKVAGFAVKPYVAPKLGAVTNQPSTKMTSGNVSLQGGTTNLQGGSSSLLYNTGGLKVTTGTTAKLSGVK